MSGKEFRPLLLLVVVALMVSIVAACGTPPATVGTATPPSLATPIADSPAAGVCADFQGSLVTVVLGTDMPSPRCVRVLATQRLAVQNDTGQATHISLGGLEADVEAGATNTFDLSFGEFLAPGVHLLSVSVPPGGVEIWLVAELPPATVTAGVSPSPSPAPTASPPAPTAEPSATPRAGASQETAFLYGFGPMTGPELFSWSPGGEPVGLDHAVFPGAIASRSGRWVATHNGYPESDGVRVHDLEAGTSAEYAATDRYHVYGLAFDLAETRLAFLELAPPEVENMPWAIVVVRLEDGMTTRLEASTLPELHRYPGNPLGWSASGDELLIATFLPYSDGLYAGVWAISVPPDTPSGMLTGLPSRLLVPGGGYRSVPRISPDGTRLLYLARDPEYMPADFEPVEDFAANQLWVLDLASGQPALLYEVTDGDALMRDAAWSPDGSEILLAQGHFAGPEFGTLALKILDAEGQPRDAPAVPVAEGKYAMSLHWCRPDLALVQYMTRDTMFELAGVDPTGTGDWWEPQSGQPAFLLGCLD